MSLTISLWRATTRLFFYTGIHPFPENFPLTVSIPVSRRFPEAGIIRRCAQVTIDELRDWGGGDVFPAGESSGGCCVKATEI
ncbi:hypothetical protein ACNI2I_20545 [Enterobacter hormaechei]|uniref:hypothetical protein n=1 Tax=Enterobacter cloacae complex TaxID=354276 RepID=UPI001C644C52|nr:hypothetical protein [Enterobacter hormaechei]EKV8997195.1 hypothetical protein [Enterobacter hormaechei]MBW7732844.1 hypothetical protein [Enterobacter hormaechei]HCU0623801.1 hypothetical protein [Enterobacter hormaechei]